MARFVLSAILPIMLAVPHLPAEAHESLIPEPADESYNFVTHYRETINAPPSKVWLVLSDLKAWMYQFELTTISGTEGKSGSVLQLYRDQNFKIQITSAIPDKLLAAANLPISFNGEHGTGVGVFTLHNVGGKTEVSLTMSRRYTEEDPENQTLRARRASKEFQVQTRTMWKDRFLKRLKELCENHGTDA